MAEKKDPRNKSKRTSRFSDMLLQVTNDLAKTKSLDEALETLVKITTSTIGAERGTIFLNDASTGELYSRIAQGNFRREIRILNTKGVAGWVFSHNEGVIIHDAYKDDRFNKAVDVRTGFRTKSILCAPLRTVSGEEIGVSQILNKIDGEFEQEDLDLLEAMTEQAAIAIQGNIIVEQIEAARKQELEFLDVVSQVSSELELTPLLQKIITTISTMLDCERATLFINDEKSNELYFNTVLSSEENDNENFDKNFSSLTLQEKPKLKKPPLYKVIMLNDDYTPMEFVVEMLQTYFSKSQEQATEIMLHIHQKGLGVCGLYTFEIAESKAAQVLDKARKNQHPLQIKLEKE